MTPDIPRDHGKVVRCQFPAMVMLREGAPSSLAAMLASYFEDAMADYQPEADDLTLNVSVRLVYSKTGDMA